jgi:spermidine/putrescine transport system substrate-binding protein
MRHPRERSNGDLSRRDFLRRSAGAAVGLPSLAAIMAACSNPTTQQGNGATAGTDIPIPRPDNPVTQPMHGEPIASGLQPEKGATLKIFNWDQYIWKHVIVEFCAKYDCDFEITTFNNMDGAIRKIQTGQLAFDIFFPTIDVLSKLVATDYLQPLNHDYLPNLKKNIWPELQNPFYDQGARYTVPYTVYTTGIGYRRDFIPDDTIFGMSNPYEILWDPQYSGKVGIYDDYREAMGMALLKNGITDVNTDDAATRTKNLELAQTELLKLVDDVDVKADVSDYTDLPQGASLIHQAWSGDLVSAQYYFPKYQVDKDVIRYWAPDKDMAIGNDFISVLNTGKNPVLAHTFLNFMLDFNDANNSGNSMVNFQWNGYLPPMKGIKTEDLIKGAGPWQTGRVVQPSLISCIPQESDFDIGVQLLELTPEVDSQWKNVWEAFQTRG